MLGRKWIKSTSCGQVKVDQKYPRMVMDMTIIGVGEITKEEPTAKKIMIMVKIERTEGEDSRGMRRGRQTMSYVE